MIKIILDEKSSDYVKRKLNLDSELKELYLDSDSSEINYDFSYFIYELLHNRTMSESLHPYKYNEKEASLTFYKTESNFSIYDYINDKIEFENL